jgi:hypothetical protein
MSACAEAMLLGSWAIGLVGYGAAFCIAARALVTRPATGDPAGVPTSALEAVALFERTDPLHAMRAFALRWESSGAALPLAAVSILAPLTLHRLVWAAFVTSSDATFRLYWMATSLGLTAHAHVVLVVQCCLWVRSFRRRTATDVQLTVHESWAKAVLAVLGVGVVPAAALLIVEPDLSTLIGLIAVSALVAITVLSFVPAMYVLTARALVREREQLTATGNGLMS